MLGFSRFRSILLAACIALAPCAAFGQSDAERAGARSAAEAGAQAFNEERYQDAVDLFRKAESLVHAPPHLLFIARAELKLGHLVLAREAYNKIVREQLSPNAPPAFVQAKADAERELAELQPRIPTITVIVKGEGAGDAQVTIDGAPIPKPLIGVPYPVDPGDHEFQARTGSAASEAVKKSVAERARESVTLELVGGSGGGTTAPVAGDAAGAASAGPQPVVPPPEADRASKKKPPIPAFVALGVGAVGVGLGTVFLVQRMGKQSDANDLFEECKTRVCSANERDEIESMDQSAASAGTLSVVGYAVGVAGVGAGVALLLTSKPGKAQARETRFVRPYFGAASAGLYGRF